MGSLFGYIVRQDLGIRFVFLGYHLSRKSFFPKMIILYFLGNSFNIIKRKHSLFFPTFLTKQALSYLQDSTADIVLLGSSNMPTQLMGSQQHPPQPPPPPHLQMQPHHGMSPHHHQQQQPHPSQMAGKPMLHTANQLNQPPNHEQVLSRIQAMHQQHAPHQHQQQLQPPHGGPISMLPQQQQQQQQQQQYGVMQQQQQSSAERKTTNRSLSTPDKQKGNSAKKRATTTPRRGANVRGAATNAAATAAAAVTPVAMSQPLSINNQAPYPMSNPLQQQQKLIAPQMQRSTNSPMLISQQQRCAMLNINNYYSTTIKILISILFSDVM